jgi:hypothetical protein
MTSEWPSSIPLKNLLGYIHRNNLKKRFLAASVLPQNFCSHSSLACRQWSLDPNKNFEAPSCQISDSSGCFGIYSRSIKKGEYKTLQTYAKQQRLHFIGAVCLDKMKTVDANAVIDFFEKIESASGDSADSAIYKK